MKLKHPHLKNTGAYMKSFLILFLFSALTLQAAIEREKLLPEQTDLKLKLKTLQSGDGEIRIYNPNSDIPQRIIGKAERIPGYSLISKDNAEQAAIAFINLKKDLLKVQTENIELVRISEVNGKFYISFRQLYKGIPTLNSEIELRIFKNGNVIAYGAKYYTDIDVDVTPTLALNIAEERAVEGLNFKSSSDKIQSSPKLYILPVMGVKGYDYKLVYKIKVEQENSNLTAYVNAKTGNLEWRYDLARNINTKLSINGGVKPVSPVDKDVEMTFQDLYGRAGATNLISNKNGEINIDIDTATKINLKFDGPWFKVTNNGKANASMTLTLAPGKDTSVSWNGSSLSYERNLFYHANFIRNYMLNIDTTIDFLNIKLPIELDYNTQNGANAAFTGDGIMFIGVGGKDMNMADAANVLYHEYGHAVNHFMYVDLGIEDGMINSSLHEGLADGLATLVQKTPEIGHGVFLSDSNFAIRRVDNNNIYPDSLNEDSHINGLIIAGAIWDLAQKIGFKKTADLYHFSRYGTPDDNKIETAFVEYLIEMLIADDDDGDLSNATPNWTAITESFKKHGIGFDLMFEIMFTHNQREEIEKAEIDYPVEIKFLYPENLPLNLSEIKLVYSTDNFKSVDTLDCQNAGGLVYGTAIPAQSEGTIIKYYFTAKNSNNSKIYTYKNHESPYMFLVGYGAAYGDDFESNKGWKLNDENLKSQWEIGNPNEGYIGINQQRIIIQSEDDHSEAGENCLVTGLTGYSDYNGIFSKILTGYTSISSGGYNIDLIKNPVLSVWVRFFKTNLVGDGESFFKISIRNNPSYQWTDVYVDDKELDDISECNWQRVIIPINDFLGESETLEIKFDALNRAFQGIPSHIFEVMVDDMEILSPLSQVAAEEIASDISIEAYPNPAYSILNIFIKNPAQQDIKVSLYDALGRESLNIYEGQAIERISSDIHSLPSGIYILKTNLNGKTITKKIIKN